MKTENTEHIKMLINGCGQVAQGFYRVAVVDAATDKVIWEMPEFKKNLILNQGMDLVATTVWANVMKIAVAGTGTRPNSIASQTDTASQSGTTVTKVGAVTDFTTDAAVGDIIKFSTLEEAIVTSVTDANHVQVTPSQTVGSTSFTIWKTAQVGLQTETKRAGNGSPVGSAYLTGTGNCGTTFSGNIVSHRRTFDFATEVGLVNYTEIGVATSTTVVNTNVFSRVLLDSAVPVDNGQKLRVIYQLNITFNPGTPSSKSATISGWPVSPAAGTAGTEQVQAWILATISSSDGGTSTDSGGLTALDPTGSGSVAVWCSPSSAALGTVGTSPDRSTNAGESPVVTLASYTSGSYQRDKTGVLAVATIPRNDIRSMGFGTTGPNVFFSYQAAHIAFTFLFNEAQTKTNTQTLSLTFRFSWSRVLA